MKVFGYIHLNIYKSNCENLKIKKCPKNTMIKQSLVKNCVFENLNTMIQL